MKILKEIRTSEYVRVTVREEGEEIARAYLYILRNDLHSQPIGYMEDVFVEERFRGTGVGTDIIRELIDEAKRRGCYKLIGTSRKERERVHVLYTRLGFVDYGKEFRMDL
jgi:GNAT superfamily N-acetyltransferase